MIILTIVLKKNWHQVKYSPLSTFSVFLVGKGTISDQPRRLFLLRFPSAEGIPPAVNI